MNEVNRLKNEIEMLRIREYESKENFEKLHMMLEQEQLKAQKFYHQFIEIQDVLNNKNEEIQHLTEKIANNNNNNTKSPTKIVIKQDNNHLNIMKEMKSSVDAIIESLSKPNDSKNLLKVSKDLLNLQDFLTGNLKASNPEDLITSLITEKQNNIYNNNNKNHKHSPSTNINSEAAEFKPSNFNIYKLASNY